MLEYFLWLPPQWRKLLFMASWFLEMVMAAVWLIYPLGQWWGFFGRKDHVSVAREIGEALPEVSDKLLNYLQLEHHPRADAALLAYELKRREQELLRWNFRDILPKRRYFAYVYLLFFPLLAGVLWRMQAGPGSWQEAYHRLAAYEEVFVPPAPFSIQIVSSLQAVPDSSYTLRVKVHGEVLPQNLILQTGSGRQPLKRLNDTVFEYTFDWINRPLRFFVESGRYVFGPYHIDLLRLPQVDSFAVALRYPAYLGRRPSKEILTRQDFEVPEGTRARWKIFFHHVDSIGGRMRQNYRFEGDSIVETFRLVKDTFLTYDLINRSNGRRQTLMFNVRVIPDLPPDIQAIRKVDTGLYRIRQYLLINASDDHSLHRLLLVYRTGDSTWHRRTLRKFGRQPVFSGTYVFPDEFGLADTLSYTYYFEVEDNNTVTGPRTARTPFYHYQPLVKNESERLQREKQTFRSAGRQLKQFGQTNRRIDRSIREMQIKPQTEWDFKTQVADYLQQSRRQKQEMWQLTKRLQTMLRDLKKNNPEDPQIKELEKRLQENQKRLQNDSLERSLQQMIDKLQKEQLLQSLEKVKDQNALEKRSMERMLELLKRFYIEQSLKRMADTLHRLARRQDSLSRQSASQLREQQKLNSQTEQLSRKFDTLARLNKELKSPVSVPPIQTGFKTARMFQRQAMEQMKGGSPSKAREAQQKAAEQLRQMASELQSAMDAGNLEQQKEDLDHIKKLIKTLIDISFEQEKLWDLDPSDQMVYARVLLDQNRLQTTLEQVADSLNAIALRQPAISEDIFDYLNNALYHGRRTLSLLQDLHFTFVMQQKEFYQNVNRLTYLLNLFLESQSQSGMAGSAGQKETGQSLPDQIHKKSQKISDLMKEGLLKDRQKQNQGNDGMSKRAWQLYKEQQQLKDMLQRFEDEYPGKRIQELNRKLEELSQKMLRQGLTRQLADQYLQWQYELLKLLHATYKQHQSEERRARTAVDRPQLSTGEKLEILKKYFPQYEQLIYNPLPLTPYYEEIYKKYKKQLQ